MMWHVQEQGSTLPAADSSGALTEARSVVSREAGGGAAKQSSDLHAGQLRKSVSSSHGKSHKVRTPAFVTPRGNAHKRRHMPLASHPVLFAEGSIAPTTTVMLLPPRIQTG